MKFIISIFLINFLVSAKTIKVCYENRDYYPHVSTKSKTPGFLVEMVQSTLKSLGHEVVFLKLPWKRCINKVKTGEADALFAAIWLLERDLWGAFPKKNGVINNELSYYQANYFLFKNLANKTHWDGRRFKKTKCDIYSPLGYVTDKKLKKIRCRGTQTLNPEAGFELLKINRIDGYVIEERIGDYLKKKVSGKDLIIKDKMPFLTTHWHMPFSHKFFVENKEIVQNIWQTLARNSRSRTPIHVKYFK